MGGIGRGEGRRDMGERGTAAHGDPPPEADAEREGVRESEKIRDTSPAPGGYRTPGHTGPKTTKHQQNINKTPTRHHYHHRHQITPQTTPQTTQNANNDNGDNGDNTNNTNNNTNN